MVQEHVQLTETQVSALRALSEARQVPVDELIRASIDSYLYLQRQPGASRAELVARAKSAIGRFASSSSDGSAEHDRYLAGAFSP